MLAPAQRLRRDRDFSSVLRARRVVRGKFLVLRGAAKPTGTTRFGFVVSKRTAKRAVDRNQVKRRLRHAVLKLPAPAQHDFIVIVQPTGVHQSQATLSHELSDLISRFSHASPRH